MIVRKSNGGESMIVATVFASLLGIAITAIIIYGGSHRRGLENFRKIQSEMDEIHRSRHITTHEWTTRVRLSKTPQGKDVDALHHVYMDTRP